MAGSGGWLLGLARLVLTLGLAIGMGNALWQTFLVNVSARPAATTLIVEVGAEIVTPTIADRSDGLNEAGWSAVQDVAKLHPDDSLPISGLRVTILGKDIAGKSYADGMRVIYGKVAGAYYDSGPNAVFDPDSVWAQAFNSLDQFVGQAQAGQAGAATQIPSIAVGVLSATVQLLTAKGHAEAVTRDNWSIGIAAVLALLLALVSRRWGRLANVAVGAFLGTLPGVAVLAGVAFQWPRSPQLFQPYAPLLHLIGDQFRPLYLAALGAAIAGIAVAIAGAIAAKILAARQPTVAPAPARARASRDSEQPKPFAPPPAPASARLTLPPEESVSPDAPTDPDMKSMPGGDAPA
jgi:hypothetical protein